MRGRDSFEYRPAKENEIATPPPGRTPLNCKSGFHIGAGCWTRQCAHFNAPLESLMRRCEKKENENAIREPKTRSVEASSGWHNEVRSSSCPVHGQGMRGVGACSATLMKLTELRFHFLSRAVVFLRASDRKQNGLSRIGLYDAHTSPRDINSIHGAV